MSNKKKAAGNAARHGSCFNGARLICRIYTLAAAGFFYFMLMPAFPFFETPVTEGNVTTVVMNGKLLGSVGGDCDIHRLYHDARRNLSDERSDIVFTEVPVFETNRSKAWFAETMTEAGMIKAIKNELMQTEEKQFSPAYSVKVNNSLVSVGDLADVRTMLKTAISAYDENGGFDVKLTQDASRQLGVIIPVIEGNGAKEPEADDMIFAGASKLFEQNAANAMLSFDDFENGVDRIGFSEDVEIVEAYLPDAEVMSAEDACRELTELKAQQIIYKVQPGDTLSEIALNAGLPMDDLIAMNDSLENENSTIHPDEELIITSPEPELSVVWSEVCRVEEIYDLPTEFKLNNEWYTNRKETLRQPSAGRRDAVVEVCRINGKETDREVLYEVVMYPPVAKLVEMGTIVPPSFVKPISGGRLTSPFGPRKRPKKGASSYHKGIDWATPIGTTVCASSGGVVSKAGWASGYGNVVYIDHPNGLQTRYGHLSKVKVKVGQKVNQGSVIALSGNTGVSTGPHIHFEMRLNGEAVNPAKYLN
ncbi:MAG: M23 family metallopeptidase [Lachnospiraceae bacterium]|nr:M23 family metallopeptidase [Lachnospiraceae bacterium]